MIVALFKRNPTLRLRKAKAELAEKGLHVSINTIRRRLAEAKVQYRPTRQKSLLSEVHMLQIYEHDLMRSAEKILEPTIRTESFKRTMTPNIAVTSARPGKRKMASRA